MSFTLPDQGEGENDLQSVFFQEYLDCLLAAMAGIDFVWESGCAVTAQGTPDMTVAVAKGAVTSNGSLLPVTAGNVTVGAADATNPRIDLIVVTSAGSKACRAGTAAASPKPPARTANDVLLAMVYVPANATTITTARITDGRFRRNTGLLKKSATPAATNTSSSIFTLATVTIPSGLFLSGKIIRCKLWGNYLSNSGTPTWTFTITYGGTTFFADATAATTADADRGAWSVEFDLIATGNATQRLDGHIRFQSPGAKNAPTTGTAGDLATVADVNAPINFTGGAVNSDAADRDLVVRATMSVSNASVETVVDGYTFEMVA
jgi:hypothetical protein